MIYLVAKAVIIAVITLVLGRIITRFINLIFLRTKVPKTIRLIFTNTTWIIIIWLGIVAILTTLGLTQAINLAGIIILSVTLLIQGLVQSTFQGYIIFLEHDYDIDDYISVSGTSGTIVDQGVRTTKVVTDTKQIAIIPNTLLYTSIIIKGKPMTDNSDQKYFYGWRPSKPDHRDYLYSAPYEAIDNIVPEYDPRPNVPDILNQSQLSACVFNSGANNIRFLQQKENLPIFLPSRLFSYWNTRNEEGTVQYDAGVEIRDAVKSFNSDGFCPETDWPYDISKFTEKPPQNAFDDAKNHHVVQYFSVLQDMTQMKACLSSGYPIMIGITVYESFESEEVARTGIVSLPQPNESIQGGHCMLLWGYSDSKQHWIVMNSWSTSWGDSGWCYLPYSYLLDTGLSGDFWTLRLLN